MINLFCLDLDETLIKGNLCEALYNEARKRQGALTPKERKEFMEKFLSDEKTGPRNPERIKSFITSCLGQGDYVAITSFYINVPAVAKQVLEKIGLTEEQITKIHIEGFPSYPDQGKSAHIKRAMKEFGIEDKSQVYLIDGSEKNCQIANQEGYNAILVEPNSDTYLTRLNEILITIPYFKILKAKAGERVDNSTNDVEPFRIKESLYSYKPVAPILEGSAQIGDDSGGGSSDGRSWKDKISTPNTSPSKGRRGGI